MSQNKKYIIGSLWIGDKLSDMEIMSINSFLVHGYEYHLYVYNKIDNIPENVVIKNGNDIINSSEIYCYLNGSVSAFSNLFRFELIYQTGTIWVDMDLICLKYYDFTEEYVIVSVPNKSYTNETIAVSIIKFPKGDPMLVTAINICKRKKNDILNGIIDWGLGPATMTDIVEKYKLNQYVKPWYFSNSCSCNHVDSIVKPNWKSCDISAKLKHIQIYSSRLKDIPSETYFIHLWNDVWRRYKLNKNATYPKNTLYEDLKSEYLYVKKANQAKSTINFFVPYTKIFYDYAIYVYKRCMPYLCYFLETKIMSKVL